MTACTPTPSLTPSPLPKFLPVQCLTPCAIPNPYEAERYFAYISENKQTMNAQWYVSSIHICCLCIDRPRVVLCTTWALTLFMCVNSVQTNSMPAQTISMYWRSYNCIQQSASVISLLYIRYICMWSYKHCSYDMAKAAVEDVWTLDGLRILLVR